ncbi:hypothetical protein PCCS19_48750 [Paenibacillus sp. CCS19]|nr:hypothetical protein PCCS19_48750 [Paenibacillus cellulosilyticus]
MSGHSFCESVLLAGRAPCLQGFQPLTPEWDGGETEAGVRLLSAGGARAPFGAQLLFEPVIYLLCENVVCGDKVG